MINNKIIIYDLNCGKELKKYEILISGIFDGKDSLFFTDFINIKKWDNLEENEFILILNKNVIIFEFNEDEKNIIDLKILNYIIDFPNIMNSYSMKN